MSDRLPQTMCLGGLQIVQTTNLHVTIYKDGKRVFHCQCDKELDFMGLMEVIRFYKFIRRCLEMSKSRANKQNRLRAQIKRQRNDVYKFKEAGKK